MIRYIVLVLAFLVLFGALLAVRNEYMSKKFKAILILVIALSLVGAYLFQANSDDDAKNRRNLLVGFEQGKTLECDGILVDNKKFNYEYGTSSFVAKRDQNDLQGVIILIDKCIFGKNNSNGL